MAARRTSARGIAGNVGRRLAPRLTELAPGATSSFVRQALDRAIRGAGPLPSAAQAAATALAAQEQPAGSEEAIAGAVHDIIEQHVRYAGAQGFVTNLGGLVTSAVTIPANITGLALVQCRMIAAIAHLRGYDLDDPRVRNAVLVCLLGDDAVRDLVKRRVLPGGPVELAGAPPDSRGAGPDLDRRISSEVGAEIISRMAGKRLAVTVGRRVPVVGGVVGMGADGFATWKVGRYADRVLLPRSTR
ncbi:EcsC family protein [Nocardioides acrostichi]|uniref:EcsC family protein n=1 Tax=Nocardioides acrostichi TaxID=2784339 RepID=A0A930V4J1_9ACTN|nr:EcsC family protein [Nocardioides acrostichi]MBF4163711.1 EcsC family protein [Nocardioides acrostichi]